MPFVTPQKQQEILARMQALGILEKDIEEQFVRGSGRGGQKKNKTSNCVVLKHVPTEIMVRCEEYREREVNRWIARRLLCEKVEEIVLGKKSQKQIEIEKKRKQKKRKARKRSV